MSNQTKLLIDVIERTPQGGVSLRGRTETNASMGFLVLDDPIKQSLEGQGRPGHWIMINYESNMSKAGKPWYKLTNWAPLEDLSGSAVPTQAPAPPPPPPQPPAPPQPAPPPAPSAPPAQALTSELPDTTFSNFMASLVGGGKCSVTMEDLPEWGAALRQAYLRYRGK